MNRTFDLDWVSKQAGVDMSGAGDENIFLRGDHGGFALAPVGDGVFEVHAYIQPEGRGKWAQEAAREGVKIAKANGAKYLLCGVAAPHIGLFARRMGMEPLGVTVQQFDKPHDLYGMDI
jgi:hypothetical protein